MALFVSVVVILQGIDLRFPSVPKRPWWSRVPTNSCFGFFDLLRI